jgi:hypothetical protein
MSHAIHAAEKSHRSYRLAWGRARKGGAQRGASKATRRLGRALAREVN